MKVQQYYAMATEAESWMKEKEPVVSNNDYGKDEDSARVRHCVCDRDCHQLIHLGIFSDVAIYATVAMILLS